MLLIVKASQRVRVGRKSLCKDLFLCVDCMTSRAYVAASIRANTQLYISACSFHRSGPSSTRSPHRLQLEAKELRLV